MQQRIDRLLQYYRTLGPVVLLESQSADHPAGRYSYLAALPEASIKAWGSQIEVQKTHKDNVSTFESNPWEALRRFRQKRGGWLFGYLGYDLKNHIEDLSSSNNDDVRAPDLFFMKPGVLI
jgi:para-aminobenzoate synthetase component 1